MSVKDDLIEGEYEDKDNENDKNYKILTSHVQDVSSKINGTENFVYLKENMPLLFCMI